MLKNLHDKVSASMKDKLESGGKVVHGNKLQEDHVVALQATDALREGMTILTENPLIVFPRFDDFHAGLVLCCGCYQVIKTKSYCSCGSCKLPMCSEQCIGTMGHGMMECVIFQQDLMKDLVEKLQKTKKNRWKLYMLIGIFRSLQLRTYDVSKWILLQTLMQYQSVDEKSRILNVIEECYNIGEILLTAKQVMNSEHHGFYPPLQAPPGHEDMVHVADTVVSITCCLIKFGVSLWPENLNSGLTSLLFTAGRILHDCSPNTGGVMDKYGSIKLVTSKPLKAGTFLTLGRHGSHSLWFIQGFQYRQPALDYQLLDHQHCSHNCNNNADNDSGINFVKCFYCQKAYLIPLGPIWKCAGCHQTAEWELIHAKVLEFAKIVEKYRGSAKVVVDDSKVFWDVKRFEQSLSPCHFVVLALKMFYMKKFTLYWEKSDEYLKRVIHYGQEILDVLAQVSTELSFYKGLVYFYMHLAHELLLERAMSPSTPDAENEYLAYHRLETMRCLVEAQRNCDWRKDMAYLEEELQVHDMISYHWQNQKCPRGGISKTNKPTQK